MHCCAVSLVCLFVCVCVCLSASSVCPLSRLAIKSKSEKCHTACGRRQCSSNNNNCSRNSSANDNNNNNRASGNCCSRIKCVVASYSLPLWLRRITWPKANSVQRCRIAKVRDGGSRRRQRGRDLPDRAQFEFAFDARSIDRLRKSFAVKYIGELAKVNTSHR